MAASANKVLFGLSNVHIALLTETTGVYSTPVAIPGAVKLALSPEGDSTEFYADNILYYTCANNNGYSGDLEAAFIPDDVLVSMLGWKTDINGVVVEVADGEQKPFALLFEVEGNAAQKRYAYYNCKAERPSNEHGTKNESTEPGTQTIGLKITPYVMGDELVVKGGLELTTANTAIYNGWYTSVVKPVWTTA